MKNAKRKGVTNKQAIKQGQRGLSPKDQKTVNRIQHAKEMKVHKNRTEITNSTTEES